MALTLIERVTKRYPRTGGTYVDMKYTEIQNPNFTVDVSKPPLTRIVDADFPDRYIVGYTRIVNDFAVTIDDIEPETMDMVVCSRVVVPEGNPANLMMARHNGHCYIKAGDNYYLSLKSWQTAISGVDGHGNKMTQILENYENNLIVMVGLDEEMFPFDDHDWLQVKEARSVNRFAWHAVPYTSLPSVDSLLREFIEFPIDKLPTFQENRIIDYINIPDENIENLYIGRLNGRDYYKVYQDGVPTVYTPTDEKELVFTSICPKGFERSASPNDVPEWVELQFHHVVDRHKDHPFVQVKSILFDTDDYSDGESSVDIATYTNLSYISGSFIELKKESLEKIGIE